MLPVLVLVLVHTVYEYTTSSTTVVPSTAVLVVRSVVMIVTIYILVPGRFLVLMCACGVNVWLYGAKTKSNNGVLTKR